MDLSEIRRLIVISVASDDVLMERLVLKGGNALDLIYRIGDRSSLDVDFSLADDFEDETEIRDRLFRALKDRFDAAGFVVFDEKFYRRPSVVAQADAATWGGYVVEFKLIAREKYVALRGDLEAIRREAQTSGPNQQRVFTIEMSKFEYTEGRVLRDVADYAVYVYTPGMIATEKLRAICQQLPSYGRRKNPAPRPRDFYDIYSIISSTAFDMTAPSNLDLVREMFKVKDVPVELLDQLEGTREFHRGGWPQVQNQVRVELEEFDFYFDFVIDLAKRLRTLLDNTTSSQDRTAD